MPYSPISVVPPPGLARAATPRATSSQRARWYDANLVRWRDGVLQPIGGWRRLGAIQLPDAARAMQIWRAKTGIETVAIGTRTKLFVYDGTLTDITPADMVPLDPPGLLDGYGVGDFGVGDFGVPAVIDEPAVSRLQPGDAWIFDNWGEDLLALHTGNGKLYRWRPGETIATVVPNAPTGASAMCVTDERAVVLAGQSTDRRRLAWSDVEDLEAWTATPDNLAGGLTLATIGRPTAMRRVRGGVLVLTEGDVHLLRYLGAPFGYGVERVASGAGIIGPHAIATTAEFAAWFGAKGLWIFDGTVRPVPCPYGSDLAQLLNVRVAPLTYGGVLQAEQELWFGFPSEATIECSRYLIWSWRDNVWTWGRLERSAFGQGSTPTHPLMAGLDGRIYEHEVGWDADGAPRHDDVWAETSDLELPAGASQLSVRGIIPDLQGEPDAVAFTLFLRDKPLGRERQVGPMILGPGRDWIEKRFAAVSMRLRVHATRDRPWMLGDVRLDAVKGGGR